MTTASNITKLEEAHLWTDDSGEVLILKCVAQDGLSYCGPNRTKTDVQFRWPLVVGAPVEAPDWTPDTVCGGGLHGWPWGFGLGDGKDADWSAKWLVFGVNSSDVIGNLEGQRKCKAKSGVIRFVGDWNGAMQFVLKGQMALVAHIASLSKTTRATGDSSASSATGDSSASSATGYRSASSATGDRSASSATGDRSASSATGDSSAAVVTGLGGKALAGKFGCIALAWWNNKDNRGEMRCRETGIGDGSDGKLKAEVWYSLDPDTGEFTEVK